MSEWRERYDDHPELANGLEWLESYYHYVVIAALGAVMVWLRVRVWGRFVVDGEVLFSGNDPWYHYRNVLYTVDHWPQTLPYEVYTNFPQGTLSGQFGTLYDQIIATIALVVGLGNPSEQLVAFVALFAPVLFAVAALIPTYLLGRRLGNRAGGVAGTIVVAFAAGTFLFRSWAGSVDHHIAEALFQALGILGIAVALAVARREKPIFEQLLDRDFAALRPTVAWSALAGVAVALYVWVWPFGVLLIGILGVFFLCQLSAEFLRGESPDHTAMVGAISMGVTGVLLLAKIQVVAFSASDFTLLQPLMAFGLAAWCLGMAWLARTWESRDLAGWQYPVLVVGILLALILLVRLVTPSIFDLFARNVMRVFGLGFAISERAATVGEVTPLQDYTEFFGWFKFAIFAALGAALWILARFALLRRVRAEAFLVVVWAVFMTMATISQERFSYYLAVPVAVLTAYTIGKLVETMSLQFDADITEFYRVAGIVSLAVLLIVPMVVIQPTAVALSTQNTPGGGVQAWDESMDWMEDNTPIEGEYGGADNAMDYDGTYAITDDYDYPAGAYGVMSWWDYGHWITVMSERIPIANPFQQHATEAANFLLAPNETQAADVLSGLSEDDAETRYVAVDWKMANTHSAPWVGTQRTQTQGKFFAPTEFYDVSEVERQDYYETLYMEQIVQQNGQEVPRLLSFNYRKQAYYESMLARLYQFHGSAVDPQPIVLDWSIERSEAIGDAVPMAWSGQRESAVREFESMAAAREFVANDSDGTSQIGGFGPYPSERVSALENYRLVGTSNRTATASRAYLTTKQLVGRAVNRSVYNRDLHPQTLEWTKLFERVPGATVEGTGPANANVTAVVGMRNERTNSTFTYQQRARTNADGEFTMTLPYSTTGYDQWGPDEGYTNVSVRATGSYSFLATGEANGTATYWNASADVPEGAVIGETDEPVTVDLEELETSPPEGAPTEPDNGTVDGGTDDGGSGDGSTDDGGTVDNETSGYVAPVTGVRP